MSKLPQPEVDESFLALLTAANEAQVPTVLRTYAESLVPVSPRGAARSMRRLVSAFVWPQSSYFHDAALLAPMQALVAGLAAAQHEDGTYDQGNIHSPPDSSFTLQDLCMIWSLLDEDGQPATRSITGMLESIIRKAGPALATGGVHTPNHRWELCAALARINHLWPHASYVERIEDWLDEGIDSDADGQYSERSAIYAAGVTNPGLLTIARLLGKDALIAHVRRNLEATLYLLEPNGEVETVHSRRQDQTQIRDVASYLLQYRELALRDGNGQFARVAHMIQQRGAGEPGDVLAAVLERPELGATLPPETALPDHYAMVFRDSGLARWRAGRTTATIFGGTDFHAVPTIASGLSTNPTFFRMRAGAAILDSVRIVPQFFNTGHFRSAGLDVLGTTYRLHSDVSVPYHLPLPRARRRSDGDYALSDDGRFFSKMDFAHRAKQFRVLRTEITVSPAGSGFDLDITFEEAAVPFTVELCFRRGGTLSGVQSMNNADTFQLIEGFGSYTVGDDRITFGPGNGAGPSQPVNMEPGEQYTYRGGSLVPDGLRVYITGRAPGRYVLQLR